MARYSLNLPSQLKQAAEAWASRRGVSLNQFILWAVSEKVGSLEQQLDDPAFPQITYRRGTSSIPAPVLRGTGIRVQTIAVTSKARGLSAAEIASEYELSIKQVEEAFSLRPTGRKSKHTWPMKRAWLSRHMAKPLHSYLQYW